jgi:hypothetical protein
MYDHWGNYTAAFLMAGVPPILGAIFMFVIYRVDGHRSSVDNVENGTSAKNEGNASTTLTESATKTTFVADDESSFVERESLLKV